jgi:Fic/DOC family
MSLRSKSRPQKSGKKSSKGQPAKRKAQAKPLKAKGPAKKKSSRPAPAKGPVKTSQAVKAKGGKAPAVDKAKLKKQQAAEKARAQAEKARAQKEREAEKKAAAKAKELALREKEREAAAKAKEKERLAKEKEREAAAKAKEKERLAKEKEREAAAKAKEKERLAKEKEREAAKLQKEREAEKARQAKAREAERVANEKERAAERERIKREREEERERIKRERDEERERVRAAKEAEREAARKLKEEERAKREAEREAYRKAKEAERERIRAEKEAARRALEGKVARASKRAQRDQARGAGARVYRPDAIPNQSGTTRRLDTPSGQQKLVGVRSLEPGQIPPEPEPARPVVPPPPPVAPSLPIEERYAKILARLNSTDPEFRREYRESFDMSWVYHDSALEGVVYTYQELKTATDPSVGSVPDGMQPVCEEIRRHRQAIEYVRELAERKRIPITVDTIKKLYVILHPDEGDVKSVKYRKDIPQHRLYFHEYAAPDKIAYRVRQVIDWLNGPEPKKLKSPIRIASRVHYDLVRVFPFPNDSGKVSRLLMNALLMRAGYPPAIIHSTERQRYYEALKGQLPIILQMANDSIINALLSIEKRFDEYDAARPSSAPAPDSSQPPPTPTLVARATANHDLDDLGDFSDAGSSDDDDDGDAEEAASGDDD